MESGLGRSYGNFKDGGGFFDGEILLVAKKEDGSAGGGDEIEQGEEGFVRQFAEIGVERGEGFGRSGVERLPAAGALEVGEGNAGGDPVNPGAKDGGLAKERQLAKDLKRGLLKDVVGEVDAGEPGDVAAQRRVYVAEELFQRGAVTGLGEKDEDGLVGRLKLLRTHAQERSWGWEKVRFWGDE